MTAWIVALAALALRALAAATAAAQTRSNPVCELTLSNPWKRDRRRRMQRREAMSGAIPGPSSSSRVDETTPLVVQRLNNGRRLLQGNLKVNIAKTGVSRKVWLQVPKGFDTDYSSLSWFGRPVVHWSKVDVAGVVHDYLYTRAGNNAAKKHGFRSRLDLDNIWYRIAIAGQHGARPWQAGICWFFIRMFGCLAYLRRPGTQLSLDECGCGCWSIDQE